MAEGEESRMNLPDPVGPEQDLNWRGQANRPAGRRPRARGPQQATIVPTLLHPRLEEYTVCMGTLFPSEAGGSTPWPEGVHRSYGVFDQREAVQLTWLVHVARRTRLISFTDHSLRDHTTRDLHFTSLFHSSYNSKTRL